MTSRPHTDSLPDARGPTRIHSLMPSAKDGDVPVPMLPETATIEACPGQWEPWYYADNVSMPACKQRSSHMVRMCTSKRATRKELACCTVCVAWPIGLLAQWPDHDVLEKESLGNKCTWCVNLSCWGGNGHALGRPLWTIATPLALPCIPLYCLALYCEVALPSIDFDAYPLVLRRLQSQPTTQPVNQTPNHQTNYCIMSSRIILKALKVFSELPPCKVQSTVAVVAAQPPSKWCSSYFTVHRIF